MTSRRREVEIRRVGEMERKKVKDGSVVQNRKAEREKERRESPF